ncbi:MAG: hypothetical protein DRH44_07765, partial [Candidatus Coatesbacteria bacterium]
MMYRITMFITITTFSLIALTGNLMGFTEDDYLLMLRLGDTTDKREACIKLAEYSSDETVFALIDALKDPDFTVKKLAIDALAKIGDERAIQPIIELFSSDDKWLRREAAEAVAEFGEDAIPYLREATESEKPWVREEALIALVKIASPETIEIFEYMSNDPDYEV